MNSLLGILVALVLIGLIASIHELGHYLTGRRLGFKVLSFQIFVGPTLVSWERGGIEYSIHLIPLGAAVNFAGEYEVKDGEDGEEIVESTDSAVFGNRPKLSRAAVLLAGPFANILTGVLAFSLAFAIAGHAVPILSSIPPDSQAAETGLQEGDRILSVNGSAVDTDLDLASGLMFNGPLDNTVLTVRREGEQMEMVLRPRKQTRPMIGISMSELSDGRVQVVEVMPESNRGDPVLSVGDIILTIAGTQVYINNISEVLESQGAKPFKLTVERKGQVSELEMRATEIESVNAIGLTLAESDSALTALPYSFRYGWSVLKMTGRSLGKLFIGELSPTETLSGPVGIVGVISEATTQTGVPLSAKVLNVLRLFALISLSVGFANLLPIPLLDGNRLLLILVEAIRGKKLSYKAQSVISVIGVAMILGLFALALYADISRLINY
ncbi:MAG: RIP metalloprotease RseP [Fastidiosipilaceae bacterium]|jgi:regulator of sigma E protease